MIVQLPIKVASHMLGTNDDTSWLLHEVGTCWKMCFINFDKASLLKAEKAGKLEFCEHYVIEKETKVKFSTTVYQTKEILNYVYRHRASLEGINWFVSFVYDYL